MARPPRRGEEGTERQPGQSQSDHTCAEREQAWGEGGQRIGTRDSEGASCGECDESRRSQRHRDRIERQGSRKPTGSIFRQARSCAQQARRSHHGGHDPPGDARQRAERGERSGYHRRTGDKEAPGGQCGHRPSDDEARRQGGDEEGDGL